MFPYSDTKYVFLLSVRLGWIVSAIHCHTRYVHPNTLASVFTEVQTISSMCFVSFLTPVRIVVEPNRLDADCRDRFSSS